MAAGDSWFGIKNKTLEISTILTSDCSILFNFTFLYTVMIRPEDGDIDVDALGSIIAESLELAEGLLLVPLMEILGYLRNMRREKVGEVLGSVVGMSIKTKC